MRNFIFGFSTYSTSCMSAQVIGKVLDKMELEYRQLIATQSNTNTNTDFDGNFSVNAKVGEILKLAC
jgi:hypothetical protein